MINVSSFFTGTLNTVDAVIGNFVSLAYANLIQANAGIITVLFTFYVMMLGFKFLNHSHHFNLLGIIQHFITMLAVYGLIMDWQLYHLFVYNIIPTKIIFLILNASIIFNIDLADLVIGHLESKRITL